MNIIKRCIVNCIIGNDLIPSTFRGKLYRTLGLDIGATWVKPKCYFNSEHIHIEEGSLINNFCQFHSGYKASHGITIGKNVFVGMNVNFCTITHELGESNQRAGENIYKPINIGDGCWIGANTTILPGVNVGQGCVIAAGSVVNRNCQPNGMYGGVPATRIKDLD